MPIRIEISDEISHFSDYVTVKELSSDGTVINSEFSMTIDQLIVLLQREKFSIDDEPEKVIETPILPPSVIKHVMVDRKEGTQDFFLHVPKKRWDVTYEGKRYFDVGFPRMVFRVRIKGNHFLTANVVALLENESLSDDMRVYKFPFGNVQSSTICMGANAFPSLKSINDLERFPAYFAALPFSSDWYVNRNKAGMGGQDEMFEELQGKDFPDEWLSSKEVTFAYQFKY